MASALAEAAAGNQDAGTRRYFETATPAVGAKGLLLEVFATKSAGSAED